MTTEAAAAQYLREYLSKVGDTPVVFNPHNLELDKLPTIFGFVNGGSPGWWSCAVVAEDGHFFPEAGHVCSHPSYAPGDLGVVSGGFGDRKHEHYRAHYPDGYRMEFVTYEEAGTHHLLQQAFGKADALHKAAEPVNLGPLPKLTDEPS